MVDLSEESEEEKAKRQRTAKSPQHSPPPSPLPWQGQEGGHGQEEGTQLASPSYVALAAIDAKGDMDDATFGAAVRSKMQARAVPYAPRA